HSHLQTIGSESGQPPGFAIEVDERPETPGLAADDRDHQRQAERAGAGERAGGPTDPEPDRKRILQRPGIDTLAGQGGTMPAGPGDVLVVADLEQQVQLLREQRVVVLELVTEQRERLDERA